MSPMKKRKGSGSPSDSQDLKSSLSDVSEAMEMCNTYMKRICMQSMERKRKLEEQSAMINELQGKMRRIESKLESLKKENEELKAKNKMIEDIQHESKEVMEKLRDHSIDIAFNFQNFSRQREGPRNGNFSWQQKLTLFLEKSREIVSCNR